MRLVQLCAPSGETHVAAVEGEQLRLIREKPSVYALAQAALERGERLAQTVVQFLSDTTVAYEPIYALESDWRLMPPMTHPEPSRCLVTGTGLTHKASADNRAAMHKKQAAELSDSERMYLSGVEGGHPGPGEIGAAPEWFYKARGTNVRAHGEPLTIPAHAEDGGEEPEIAGIYIVDAEGRPRRAGMAIANEFSDHVLEKRNYLYLAASKMRTCALGPELILDPDFSHVRGTVSIERAGEVLWSNPIASGEAKMSHSLANLESSLQIRSSSQAGGCSRAFLWSGRVQLRRRNTLAGWRCDGHRFRGVWPAAAKSRSDRA